MTIVEYLDVVKERLLTDPIVADFRILRERASLSDGYLRVRLTLADNTWLEFSEYVQRFLDEKTSLERSRKVNVITYSYHWANADNELVKRWDDTPHFPDLAGFPHHIHIGSTGRVIPGQAMSIFVVLDEIAKQNAAYSEAVITADIEDIRTGLE